MTRYWLMKSEPGAYAIDDLERDGTTHWDGVRSYEARNFMQDMQVGDKALFYHSNAKPTGPIGIMEVVKEAYPDFTAWDPENKHFDPKTDPDDPRWFMVDVGFVERFPRTVALSEIKEDPALADMMLITRFRAPSVQPVEKHHFDRIVELATS